MRRHLVTSSSTSAGMLGAASLLASGAALAALLWALTPHPQGYLAQADDSSPAYAAAAAPDTAAPQVVRLSMQSEMPR